MALVEIDGFFLRGSLQPSGGSSVTAKRDVKVSLDLWPDSLRNSTALQRPEPTRGEKMTYWFDNFVATDPMAKISVILTALAAAMFLSWNAYAL